MFDFATHYLYLPATNGRYPFNLSSGRSIYYLEFSYPILAETIIDSLPEFKKVSSTVLSIGDSKFHSMLSTKSEDGFPEYNTCMIFKFVGIDEDVKKFWADVERLNSIFSRTTMGIELDVNYEGNNVSTLIMSCDDYSEMLLTDVQKFIFYCDTFTSCIDSHTIVEYLNSYKYLSEKHLNKDNLLIFTTPMYSINFVKYFNIRTFKYDILRDFIYKLEFLVARADQVTEKLFDMINNISILKESLEDLYNE